MDIIIFTALTLSAMFGFVYGVVKFFREPSALYSRMIVFGVGCMMLGRLFETLQLVTAGEIHHGFHVGLLGIIGSFLFFLTANYGQMDSLADDGSPAMRKYRWMALAAPLAVTAIYMVIIFLAGWGEHAIVDGILTLVIAQASYYHLKHLIVPDVKGAIIYSIRGYNLMALIYAALCMAEMIVKYLPPAFIIRYVIYGAQCVIAIVFIPVLEGGVKKWRI
ncbi:MAG: hypothetical protein II627_09300 [Lachnospiraceae bacterium]|nr:hypothetical protein [Lachnospiraceae bacterium]